MQKKSNILLIRHAQSYYNICEIEAVKEKKDFLLFRYRPDFIDCSLSEEGHQQAITASKIVQEEDVKYVFASPLRRALQTTRLLFESHKNKPKVIVLPLLREHLSTSCDIPDNLDMLMGEFPDYDFSLFSEYEDKKLWIIHTLQDEAVKKELLVAYNEEFLKLMDNKLSFSEYILEKMKALHPKQFESRVNLRERTEKVKNIVKEYQAKLMENEHIAIVSHYSFLKMFTATSFKDTGKAINGLCFENCEVVKYAL